MANPQKEDGYTPIANEILDALVQAPFLGAELRVILYIIRKTYGFGKTEDGISLTQFEHATNQSRPTVVKAIKNLQLVNTIELVNSGNSKNSFNIYKFNKNYESWKLVNTCQLVKRNNLTSKEKAKKLVNTCQHTKENTKENTKEKAQVILPEKINSETWQAYLEMRKAIRKPATKHAQKLIIKKLLTMKDDPNLVLEQSIQNSWQGVFDLKRSNYGDGTLKKRIWSERDAINSEAGDLAEIAARKFESKLKASAGNPGDDAT